MADRTTRGLVLVGMGCVLVTAVYFAVSHLASVPSQQSANSSSAPSAMNEGEEPLKPPQIVRFASNPILRPDMIPKTDGAHSTNLNFPCLIRVPDWIDKPLGKYYLYFSSHHGLYIRLAYADKVEGPWQIYAPGTLTMEQVEAINKEKEDKGRHTATPDILIDSEKKQIRMYFHYKMPTLGHSSSVAVSQDGLHFEPQPGALGEPYYRVFTWQKDYYAIDRRADILKSSDGLKDFRVVSKAIRSATAKRHRCRGSV